MFVYLYTVMDKNIGTLNVIKAAVKINLHFIINFRKIFDIPPIVNYYYPMKGSIFVIFSTINLHNRLDHVCQGCQYFCP